ncbi:MAG: zinc ribbon domain-containing protein [Actinobacteria bacterium]|nr:zinc ribbon domain-containing protein [Actinomycetota bacterium]
MNCPQCGKPAEEGSTRCNNCGAAIVPQTGNGEGASGNTPREEPAAASASDAPVTPSPQRDGAPSPRAARRAKRKSKRRALLIGAVGLLVIAAVVLVLVFVVFKGDSDGGGGSSATLSDPGAAVELFFQGIVDADVDILASAIDPVYIEEFEVEFGQDYKDLLQGFFLAVNPEELEITGLDFEVEKSGDEAQVRIIAGTVSYLDANGEKVTEDITGNVITDFDTVRVGDRWYVSMSTFPDWWYYLNAVTGEE